MKPTKKYNDCEGNIKKGNSLYARALYKEALAVYQEIVDRKEPLSQIVTLNIRACKKKLKREEANLVNSHDSDQLLSLSEYKDSSASKIVSPHYTPPHSTESCSQLDNDYFFSAFNPASIKKDSTSLNMVTAFRALHGSHPIYFPPVERPVVSIVIPVFRGLKELEDCLRSIAVHIQTEPHFEVILVDDCPSERTIWAIPQSGGLLKVENEKNMGFLLSCNHAASFARGKYVCFLNSDTMVSAGWLYSMVACYSSTRDAGVVGGMLVNCDGTIQDAGWRILNNGWGVPIGNGKSVSDGHYRYRREVDCVTGANLLISRELFNSMKGFDPWYAPAFYEEFDFCFRVRLLGLKTIYEPGCRVIHLGSSSYGEEIRNKLSGINHKKFSQRFVDIISRQPSKEEDLFGLLEIESGKFTILILDYEVPQQNRHAGDVTMFRYIQMMVQMGMRVILFPSQFIADDPHAVILERMGVMILRDFEHFEPWLKKNSKHIQHFLLSRPNIASHLIDMIRWNSKAKISYYTHDLHYVRLEKEAEITQNILKLEESKKIKEVEFSIFARVDKVLSPSATEASLILKGNASINVSVIPPYFFGDYEFFERNESHFSKLNDILFVGGFPHTPNVDAAVFIAQDIMPKVWLKKPFARLILVGYAPPERILRLANDRIIVTGQVPKLEPYYDQARLVLCALRYGAGVKGKTIEAMRFGVPIVSTDIGVEGIDVVSGIHVLISNTADQLAKNVIDLFDSASDCAFLSRESLKLVKSEYSMLNAKKIFQNIFY